MPIFDKKNVIVAGGAGFIGSYMCEELIKDSKVICLDNFIDGEERNIDKLLSNPNFVFIKHNINEPIDLEILPELQKFKIEFQGIQEIYNFACPTSPKNFKKNIQEILETNSLGVKNLLDLAIKYKSKFFHASSSVVYGPRKLNIKTPEYYPGVVDINSERGAYDEGKRFAETLVMNYAKIYNLDVRIARIFRTFGPRMKLNDNRMLPDFIYNALKNKNIVIYGDKNFSSSFCYIKDIIDGIKKLMASNLKEPVNLGSERIIKVSEIAKKIIKKLNSSSEIEYHNPILFMTQLCLPDIKKAKDELGWLPIISLDKGLDILIDYVKASESLLDIEQAI